MRRYLLPLGVCKYGPVISMDVTAKGATGSSICPRGATNSRSPFLCWHESQFFMYSPMDFLMFGHQYRSEIRSFVLFVPGWETYTGSWVSLMTSCIRDSGTINWCLPSDFRLYHIPSLSRKTLACYDRALRTVCSRKRLLPVHVVRSPCLGRHRF